MIPLHSAIRGLSSLDTVQTLLRADPSSVYIKDSRGRNAVLLAEKVYGKSHRMGDGDVYKKLLAMLASSLRGLKPTQAVIEDNSPTQKIEQLQEENLALRSENRELRERAEINEHLLQRLVEKLQEIENYNRVFGVDSNDDMDTRRDQILLTLSQEEASSEQGNSKSKTQVETTEHKTGGDGAYSKRLQRYESQTPSKSESDTMHWVSPAETEVTEPLSPFVDGDDPRETASSTKMTDESEDFNDVNTKPESDKDSPTKDQNIFRANEERSVDKSRSPSSQSNDTPAANLSEKFERMASANTEKAKTESPPIDPIDLLLVVD